MEFENIIKKRHSSRDLIPKASAWKEVIDAIDCALQGPFAGNVNNLKFVIVEDPVTIKKIAKQCKQLWISQAGLLLIVCSDDRHLVSMYGERGRVYAKQQAGAAIMTIIFKLTESGLSTCWVGAFTDELIKSALKIPAHVEVEAILPIGKEKSSRTKIFRKKQKLEAVINWEKWNKFKRPTAFESHPKEPV